MIGLDLHEIVYQRPICLAALQSCGDFQKIAVIFIVQPRIFGTQADRIPFSPADITK